MSVTLFAQPYDINATGFYFKDNADFRTQYETHLPVEEYEIMYIDGPRFAAEIFDAMSVNQGSIEEYINTLDTLERDEHAQASFCYVLENGLAKTTEDALEVAQNEISLFEGTALEYAENLVEDCYKTKETSEFFLQYFDYLAFSRDLLIGGDIHEYTHCGKKYIVASS